MLDLTGVTLHHGDEEVPYEDGPIVVREPVRPPYQPRRLLTLDVHHEIDPSTREWITVDETCCAMMDADEALAKARGAAFETWLSGKDFNSDQLGALHLVKE